MKHNLQITIILISMFFLTQLIGLAVVRAYNPVIEQVEIDGEMREVNVNPLPYNLEVPEVESPVRGLSSIISAFVIAILLVYLLMRFNLKMFLRIWFFVVIIIVIAISLNALFKLFIPFPSLVALAVALPLAVWKVFKRNIIIHNFTELLIYPGIAVVLIAFLTQWGANATLLLIIILLLLISAYDIWAVWHSGFMQRMAKFQIEELKLFGGFFVPYLSKKQRQQIKEARLKMKQGKKIKAKKMKVSLAILGGGDIVFPIITAGVILRSIGFIQSFIVILGATLALSGLFIYSQKGKFYPAMPFITIGLLVGMVIAYLI